MQLTKEQTIALLKVIKLYLKIAPDYETEQQISSIEEIHHQLEDSLPPGNADDPL